MQLPYELKMLPFPPRAHAREFLQVNPLGTIPAFFDDATQMTESAAICHYLVTRHGPTPLNVIVDEPAYGAFLNYLHFGEATLTFPQTLVLRYGRFESGSRRQPQVAEDYSKWFVARLRTLEPRLAAEEFLCRSEVVPHVVRETAVARGDVAADEVQRFGGAAGHQRRFANGADGWRPGRAGCRGFAHGHRRGPRSRRSSSCASAALPRRNALRCSRSGVARISPTRPDRPLPPAARHSSRSRPICISCSRSVSAFAAALNSDIPLIAETFPFRVQSCV
jgi:hypothetical protein